MWNLRVLLDIIKALSGWYERSRNLGCTERRLHKPPECATPAPACTQTRLRVHLGSVGFFMRYEDRRSWSREPTFYILTHAPRHKKVSYTKKEETRSQLRQAPRPPGLTHDDAMVFVFWSRFSPEKSACGLLPPRFLLFLRFLKQKQAINQINNRQLIRYNNQYSS